MSQSDPAPGPSPKHDTSLWFEIKVDVEPNIIDISTQIGLLANFGADVMQKHGHMKLDVVVIIEWQQEIGTKATVIVNLDHPP